jgi:hypothetical protein
MLLVAVVVSTSVADARGWSGGPVFNVTDLDPKCAVCHSSMSREQLRVEPPGVQNFYFVENRHYKPIQDGTGPYASMSPADRQRLLADVKAMDEAVSVTLSMPESARISRCRHARFRVMTGSSSLRPGCGRATEWSRRGG